MEDAEEREEAAAAATEESKSWESAVPTKLPVVPPGNKSWYVITTSEEAVLGEGEKDEVRAVEGIKP